MVLSVAVPSFALNSAPPFPRLSCERTSRARRETAARPGSDAHRKKNEQDYYFYYTFRDSKHGGGGGVSPPEELGVSRPGIPLTPAGQLSRT